MEFLVRFCGFLAWIDSDTRKKKKKRRCLALRLLRSKREPFFSSTFSRVYFAEQRAHIQNMAASTSGDKAADDSLYPIAVLIDELKNEDIQVSFAGRDVGILGRKQPGGDATRGKVTAVARVKVLPRERQIECAESAFRMVLMIYFYFQTQQRECPQITSRKNCLFATSLLPYAPVFV